MIYLDLYLQGFFLVFFFVYFFLCVCGGGSLAENDSLILQSPVSIKRTVNTGLKTNPIKSITWESQMSEKVNLFSNCTLLKNPNLCFVWKWNTIFFFKSSSNQQETEIKQMPYSHRVRMVFLLAPYTSCQQTKCQMIPIIISQ